MLIAKFQLVLDQVIVGSALGCQRLVVTSLNYLAVVDNHYLVSIADGTQAMGDNDDSLAFIEPVEILYDGTLIVSVKGVRCLVKEDIVGILVHSTGNKDTLLLSLAQADTITSDLRIVLQRKRQDIIFDTGYLGGSQQPFFVYVTIIYCYVASDALGEDHAVLHDDTTLAPPPFLVERVDIDTTDINRAFQDRIIA